MDEEKDLNEGQTPGEEGQGENAGESKEDTGGESSEASQEGSRE